MTRAGGEQEGKRGNYGGTVGGITEQTEHSIKDFDASTQQKMLKMFTKFVHFFKGKLRNYYLCLFGKQ